VPERMDRALVLELIARHEWAGLTSALVNFIPLHGGDGKLPLQGLYFGC
jgi:hypothetical protein